LYIPGVATGAVTGVGEGVLCGMADVLLKDGDDSRLEISGDEERVPASSVTSSVFVAARTAHQGKKTNEK